MRGRRHRVDDLAQHELDDAFFRAFVDVDHPNGRAFAEDRGPVTDGVDLDHPMRDEDHGPLAPTLPADHLEHSRGQVGGEGRGHLVEHQDVRLDGHRAREVDDAERREGQPPGQGRQLEIGDAELGHPVTERFEGRVGQPEICPDIEVGDERRLLVDGHQPTSTGLAR